MQNNNSNELLFSEFKEVLTQEWEELIKKDLKGDDYDKKLISTTIENLKIKPYYRQENLETSSYTNSLPGEFPYTSGTETNPESAKIRQTIKISDIEKANNEIKFVISKGANSFGIEFEKTELIGKNEFDKLFSEINLNELEIIFHNGDFSNSLVKSFADFAEQKKINPDSINVNFEYSPLANLSTTGQYYKNENKGIFSNFKELLDLSSKLNPNTKILCIPGDIFNNARTSAVEELAFSLSMGNDYLCLAEEKGVSASQIAEKVFFRFAIGSDYFMEIAKLRAARFLWAKIVEKHTGNTDSGKMHILTVTTNSNKTIYDSYVNVLRATTESMSAIIGGSRSHEVLPFDNNFKESNDFSQRIARNIQIILKEEAYFDKTTDPAAGSYYLESLTDMLIEKSWDLFLETEKTGGYFKALQSGFIQTKIEEIASKRDLNIALQKEILLGTNRFPNKDEKSGIAETILQQEQSDLQNNIVKPIKIYRASEEFEKFRAKIELKERPPKVFMLTFGNLNMRRARAGFAINFFASGGFEIIDNHGFETIQDAVNKTVSSCADITVICSSDQEYPEIVPEICKELSGKTKIVLAGNPVNHIEEFKKAGIEYFIHAKSNILETLKLFV